MPKTNKTNVMQFPTQQQPKGIRVQLPKAIEAEMMPDVRYVATSGENAWVLLNDRREPIGYFFRITGSGTHDFSIQVNPEPV